MEEQGRERLGTASGRGRIGRRGPLRPGRTMRERAVVPVILVAALLAVAVLTAGLIRFLGPDPLVVVGIPLAALALLAVFLIPVQILPTLVLVVLALVPTRLIPNDGPFNALPPLAILMGVWVFRRWVLGHRAPGEPLPDPDLRRFGPRFAVYATAILFTGWLVISMIMAGGGEIPVGWTMSFVVSTLLPLLVMDARAEVRLLTRAFLILGALVGAYLLVEMVLGTSPLYGWVDAIVMPSGDDFEFAVYRAQAGFSHPLFAAAFLTIPAGLGIGMWMTTGRVWQLVCAGLAGLGVVATVSRGTIAAVAVAVAFALLIGPVFIGWRNAKRWIFFLAAAAVGAIVVLNFGPLVERSGSIESALSAGVRERAVGVAVTAAEQSAWVGTGPGTSGETGRLYDSIVIENSLLQLLISVGIPGVVFFLGFIAALMWQAWSRGGLAVVLALVAYVVAISGFNSLDGVRPMHVLIGFLVLLAMHWVPIGTPLTEPVEAFDEDAAHERGAGPRADPVVSDPESRSRVALHV